MNIYTKTGDEGITSLLGGKRVQKDCQEMHGIGEVDELNSLLGVVISHLEYGDEEAMLGLTQIQHTLFNIGSQLAAVQTDLVKAPAVTVEQVADLEHWIDSLEAQLPPLTQFVVPMGSQGASYCFYARAVCRRAERHIISLKRSYPDLPPTIQQYLNRLSDLLFVLGRYINQVDGIGDVYWQKS